MSSAVDTLSQSVASMDIDGDDRDIHETFQRATRQIYIMKVLSINKETGQREERIVNCTFNRLPIGEKINTLRAYHLSERDIHTLLFSDY